MCTSLLQYLSVFLPGRKALLKDSKNCWSRFFCFYAAVAQSRAYTCLNRLMVAL